MRSIGFLTGLAVLASSSPLPARFTSTFSTTLMTTATSPGAEFPAVNMSPPQTFTLPTPEDIRHVLEGVEEKWHDRMNRLVEVARQNLRDSPAAPIDMPPSQALRLPRPLSSEYLLSLSGQEEKETDQLEEGAAPEEDKQVVATDGTEQQEQKQEQQQQSSVAGCTDSSDNPGFLLGIWRWFRSLHFLVQIIAGFLAFAFVCSQIVERKRDARSHREESSALGKYSDRKSREDKSTATSAEENVAVYRD